MKNFLKHSPKNSHCLDNKSKVPRFKVLPNILHTSRVTQMYSVEKYGDKLYNVSNGKNFICGINFPNHELYVKDENQIAWANQRIQNGYVELCPGLEQKTFNGVNYISIIPRYKDGILKNKRFTHVGFYDDLREDGPLPFSTKEEVESDLTISNIIHDAETIRKIFIQWVTTYGAINNRAKDLNSYYSSVYKNIYQYLNGQIQEQKCIQEVEEFICFLECTPKTPFDWDGLMFEINIISMRLKNNILMLQGCDLSERKIKLAALRYEELHTQEASFPAGCDLMATTLNLQKDDSLYYQARKEDAIDFHYATMILDEGLDFIVMEGFARGRQGFDHNWEFIMHGGLIADHINSFKRYNDILFESYLDTKVLNSFSDERKSINLKYVEALHENSGL